MRRAFPARAAHPDEATGLGPPCPGRRMLGPHSARVLQNARRGRRVHLAFARSRISSRLAPAQVRVLWRKADLNRLLWEHARSQFSRTSNFDALRSYVSD